MKKRIISLFLVAAMMCSLCISVSADNISISDESIITGRESRLLEIFTSKVEQMENEEELSIDCIKTVYDFAGNEYTVIECSPTGYIIYHNASALFVEYSASAPSPYLGLDNDLYYCGPTYYYYKSSDSYNHTFLAEELSAEEAESELTATSLQINSNLIDDANVQRLSYINDGTASAAITELQTASSFTHVPNYAWINKLRTESQIGYMDGNYCGYIGMGILLNYADACWDSNIIDDSTYLTSSHTFNGPSFTQLLISYGITLGYTPNRSTAADSFAVINYYLGIRENATGSELNPTHHYHSLLPSDSTLVGYINSGLPVQLYGNVPDLNPEAGEGATAFHSILLYGYSGSGSTLTYKVHYGWPITELRSYHDVKFLASTMTNGSAYTFELN